MALIEKVNEVNEKISQTLKSGKLQGDWQIVFYQNSITQQEN